MTQPVSVDSAVPSMVGVRVASIALSLCSSVVIARSLGPYHKGVYNLLVLLPMLYSTLLDFGVSNGLFFHVARKDISLDDAYGGLLLHLGAMLLFVAVPVSILGSGLLAGTFPHVPRSWMLVAILVLGPLTMHGQMANGILLGTNRSLATYVLPLVTQLLSVVGVVVSAIEGFGVIGMVLAILAATLLVQILYGALLRTNGAVRARPRPIIVGRAVAFGWPLYLASLSSVLHSRVDQVWMATVLRPDVLGQYALAVSIGETLWSIDLPVISALQYHVASRNETNATELVNRATRLIMLTMALVCAAAALSAPIIVPAVYGSPYRPAVRALLAYLPAVLFWSGARSVGQDIGYQRRRTDLVLYLNLVGLAVNAMLLAVLLKSMGAVGASLASTGSYFVMLIAAAAMHSRLSRTPWHAALIPRPADAAWLVAFVRPRVGSILRPRSRFR